MSALGAALERAKESQTPRGAVVIYFRQDGSPLESHIRHDRRPIDRLVARELAAKDWPASAVRAMVVVLYPDRHEGAPVDFRFEGKQKIEG